MAVSRKFVVIALAGLALAGTALTAFDAAAAPSLIKSIKGNDCQSIPFDDCHISQSGITTDGPSGDKSSPTIGRKNATEVGSDLDFPLSGYEAGLEADGNLFTVNFDPVTKILDWTYTGTKEIHYVVYKQASFYHVFYDAVAFTTHTIELDLPLGSGGIGANAVSHITWFNTGGGPGPTDVPLPATLALFGAGLIGLAGLRRRLA